MLEGQTCARHPSEACILLGTQMVNNLLIQQIIMEYLSWCQALF